ncbi:MAG: hypothetical protein RLZ04_2115, partial [Actinomycetota bacterium]
EDSHPHVVKVLRSPGAGPAEARNEGLRSARGLWVSFPDGDDLLASDYLRQVRTAIAENGGDLGCVMTKLVNYFEVDGTRADSHPLTFKFSRSTTVELIGTTPRAIQLSAATVFLPRDILVSEGLEFDPRIAPTFEDGHLVNRVLSRMLDRTVAYVPAEYSYRRRASGGSLTNLAPQSTSWYLECVEFGHLGLLDDCRRRLGDVPEFVKWTVLYDLIPKLRHLVHHPEVAEVLGDDGAERFHELLTAVIREVGSRTIREYDLPGLTEEYRVGLLRLAGDVPSSPSRRVYVEEWNPRRCEARLSWLAAELDEPPVVFSLGARPAATRPGGSSTTHVLGETMWHRCSAWVGLEHGEVLTGDRNGVRVEFRSGGRRLGSAVDSALIDSTVRGSLSESRMPAAIRELRELATSPEAVEKWRGSWLLADLVDRADDNAEALYRFLMTHGVGHRIAYLLDRDSSDWERLERDGFDLVAAGSPEHFVAHANCELLIGSHSHGQVRTPFGEAAMAGLVRHEFVFLQHGVIHHDLSGWLNRRKVRMMITSTRREHESIVAAGSSYELSECEVKMTGLPRHDVLLSDCGQPDVVLFAPTWRRYLFDPQRDFGHEPERIKAARESCAVAEWNELMHYRPLLDLCERKGLRIVLAMHPNLAPIAEAFEVPSGVLALADFMDGRYATALSHCAALVTDYSSISFDAALLNRPVVYLHPDHRAFFGGGHTVARGYFDYERDGFGPVTETGTRAATVLARELTGPADPVYSGRRATAFAYRDGQNCQRVADVLTQMTA